MKKTAINPNGYRAMDIIEISSKTTQTFCYIDECSNGYIVNFWFDIGDDVVYDGYVKYRSLRHAIEVAQSYTKINVPRTFTPAEDQ